MNLYNTTSLWDFLSNFKLFTTIFFYFKHKKTFQLKNTKQNHKQAPVKGGI